VNALKQSDAVRKRPQGTHKLSFDGLNGAKMNVTGEKSSARIEDWIKGYLVGN